MRRNDPDAHEQQVNDGYITGAVVQRPAVISVDMYAASLAVNEFWPGCIRSGKNRTLPGQRWSSASQAWNCSAIRMKASVNSWRGVRQGFVGSAWAAKGRRWLDEAATSGQGGACDCGRRVMSLR